MIKLIDINKIFPHPDNPRKDLGDLTELAESIKQSGILQNLTVVKREGEKIKDWLGEAYTVIIGHRRLAAAKIAGLEEVPCAIAEMDHKTQVATMLLENMQRSDLTVYEQAQGFQMMLDLGETVNDISEKTGFSETTVRRRVKLLDLDQEKLKESTERGGTLTDYIELEKIEDIELRNKVLESIGTENFRWELQKAKNVEKRIEWAKEITAQLDEFATEVEEVAENFTCVKYYNDTASSWDIVKPGDADTRKYTYQVSSYGQIRLYREEEEITEEKIKKEEEENAKKAEREARVKEIKERSSKLREDFIYSLTNAKLMNHIGEILLLAVEARTSFFMWESDYIETFKLEIQEEDFEFDVIEEEMIKRPALSLLKIIYNEDLKNLSYFNFRGEYSANKELDKLYDILIKIGYEMSEEEKQLQDGTHELFLEEVD